MVREDRPLARDFDGNGACIDADLGTAVEDGEGHGRSLNMTGEATSCGFSRVVARMGFQVAAAFSVLDVCGTDISLYRG